MRTSVYSVTRIIFYRPKFFVILKHLLYNIHILLDDDILQRPVSGDRVVRTYSAISNYRNNNDRTQHKIQRVRIANIRIRLIGSVIERKP